MLSIQDMEMAMYDKWVILSHVVLHCINIAIL